MDMSLAGCKGRFANVELIKQFKILGAHGGKFTVVGLLLVLVRCCTWCCIWCCSCSDPVPSMVYPAATSANILANGGFPAH